MNNAGVFIFGCLVFGGGAAMMVLHWDKRFRQRFRELSDDESEFHRKQYIRRMITSGLITVVGILFMVYRFLPPKSIAKIYVIAAVLLLVGVIIIFAVIDFGAIGKLFRIEKKQSARASRELADEYKRLREKAQQLKEAEQDSDSDPDDSAT